MAKFSGDFGNTSTNPGNGSLITKLLLTILQKADEQNIPYVVMTPCTEQPPGVASDVDLALSADPRTSIEPILMDLQRQGKIDILQRLYYEIPAGYYYMLRLCEGEGLQLLHLDCLFDPYGIDRYGSFTPALIGGRVREWWGYRPNDRDLAVYYLIKRAVKGRLSSGQLAELQQLLARANGDEVESEVERLAGDKSRGVIAELSEASTVEAAALALARFHRGWTRLQWLGHPLKWLHRNFRNLLRITYRLIKPTGLFVVLLGPDGCGKSTLAAAISDHLSRCYRRVWRFHWRPGLLPKLSRGATNPPPSQLAEPPREAKYGTCVSLARYLYYLADFIAGYWVPIYFRKAATTLVIGERWHYDVIVNPQRYGFRLPQWLLRMGQLFIPRPNLVLLLTASPEVIHSRKPELTTAEIQAQIEGFRKIFAHNAGAVEVNTGAEMPETIRQMQQVILGETCRITGRRLGGASEWQGFGPQADPKVWRHRDERPGQALQLYQPASIKGRLAKLAASQAPGMISERFFFRASPSPEEAARLRQHVQVVQKVVGDPGGFTVSFGTGSPGPHRKITGQVSVGRAVCAYVKIGDEAVAQLLDTEARALSSGMAAPRAAFQSPSLMADVSERGYRYLFLKGAGSDARQRPLQPDRLDQLFLLHWITADQRQMPIGEILSKLPPAAPGLERADAQILADTQAYVRQAFKDTGVRVWPSHGDYAPWNTLRLPDGTLYVFDWEHFNEHAPALRDVFHRIFMPARLVHGLSPAQIVKRLLAIPGDAIFGCVIDNSGLILRELPAYLMLYFLGMMKWRGSGDPLFISFLIACMRIVLLKVGFKGYRKRVLVSAYACEPGKGSEPGVGWNWVQTITKHADAWVITKGNNREPIEKELGRGVNDRLRFEYVELPRWLAFWKKGPRGVRLYYYLWQFAALARARKIMRSHIFDLGHHITFVNDRVWTFLALLPLPFIWGPIGSNIGIPRHLLESYWSGFRYLVKRSFQSIVRCLDPLYWLSVLRAAKIICINSLVAQSLPLRLAASGKIIIEPAIAVENLPTPPVPPVKNERQLGLQVLFMGKFIGIKGPEMAMEAFARFASTTPESHFTMVGDGPLLKGLRRQANALGVTDKVTFIPWLPRTEALQLFRAHDVFLFPSMEGAGMVVLEAMASGLPVICLDFGGPGQMVSPEAGIKVKTGARAEVIRDLAEALLQISQDPAWFEVARQERIIQTVRSRFSWEAKERVISELYDAVL